MGAGCAKGWVQSTIYVIATEGIFLIIMAVLLKSRNLSAGKWLNCLHLVRGWKRNNWISYIHYSIHFFLSYSLFLIQFCLIFIIPFQVIPYSFTETV